jgi:hypothetical protein
VNNLEIAQSLRALAEAVKNAPQEWGTVGVGGDTVEKLVFIEHENLQYFEVSLTPPPLGTGQNVVHSNDDDGNDGRKLPSQLILEYFEKVMKGK